MTTTRTPEACAAEAEIKRLRGVCEEWAEKYAGWRDACLAAEAAVARAEALADEWETLLVDYTCCGCASPNAVSTSRFADDLRAALTYGATASE